jgi:hypothetical protein
MHNAQRSARKIDRIFFLDNLRTFMIFLVVVLHAGIVYEASGVGAWFWIVDDPSTNDLVGILNIVLDIFVMSTIFFVSGYFIPGSVRMKSPVEFLKAKARRLMVPWLIAVFTLMPAYKFIFLYSRGLPQESWTTYFHFSNGILSQSWLWFLPVLFLFDVLYLALSRSGMDLSKLSLKAGILGTFLVGIAYSIFMSLCNLYGWTKIVLLDFQNERILIYFMVFLLGALCYELKAFDGKPRSTTLYKVVNWTSWIPITVYVIAVIYSFLKPGQYLVSRVFDVSFMLVFFNLSLLCLVYSLVMAFWINFNKPGRLRDELNKNSYGAYIIHVIVLGGIALILLDTAMPSLVKYSVLVLSTYLVCNVIVHFYRISIKGIIQGA